MHIFVKKESDVWGMSAFQSCNLGGHTYKTKER